MGKMFYIIPGFRDSKELSGYKEISKLLTEKGIENKIIDITWSNKVMSNYVDEALSQLDLTKQIHFIGFSYGAFISFVLSTKVNTEKQILLSLSPYFKEDLPKIKGWWKRYVGKKRVNDLHNFSFDHLVNLVKCQTSLLVGEKEDISLINRAKEAKEKIKDSTLEVVKKARHNINDINYLVAIKSRLNQVLTD